MTRAAAHDSATCFPGEALPYHKHDHPSPQDRRTAPTGYQRHDSFPVPTQGLGTVVEQSFDFGGGGRRFGAFDRGSDGGDVVIVSPGISPGAVSIGATETGGGFNLWVGQCRGAVEPDALARSWLILEFDPNRPEPMSGETVARLNAARLNARWGQPRRMPDAPQSRADELARRAVRLSRRPGPGSADHAEIR